MFRFDNGYDVRRNTGRTVVLYNKTDANNVNETRGERIACGVLQLLENNPYEILAEMRDYPRDIILDNFNVRGTVRARFPKFSDIIVPFQVSNIKALSVQYKLENNELCKSDGCKLSIHGTTDILFCFASS